MSVVGWLDLVALLAYATALGGVATGRAPVQRRDARALVAVVLVLLVLRAATSLAESGLGSEAVDAVNDLLRSGVPFALGMLLYVLIDEQARGELARRERQLRRALEASGMSAWEWAIDADRVTWFLRTEQLLGAAPGIPLGGLDDFLHEVYEADRDAVRVAVKRLLAGDGDLDVQYRVTARDGRVRWVHALGSLERDASGVPVRAAGTAKDVTAARAAREALSRSEQRFRDLIEGSIQGICIHHDMVPVFANRAFARMFGYQDPDQILALGSILPLFAPAERGRVQDYNAGRHADEVVPEVYEFEGLRRDGTPIVVQNVARRVSWLGRPAIQATMVDVTERYRAEQRVQAEKRFIDEVLDSLPGVFYLFGSDGRMLRWNRAFEEQSGYTAEDMARMRPVDFFEGEERELIAERVARVFSHGESSAEAHLVTRDGRRIPHFFSGRRLLVDGEPCLVGMGLDISELEQAEAALRDSEERFRALYDDNPTMYMTLDARGTIRSINRYGAAQLGYEVDELVGAPAEVLYPQDAHEALRRLLEQCEAKPGEAQRVELPRCRKGGGRIWVRETARAQHGPGGELRILTVAEDVSEAHDLSRQLEYQASHDGLTDLLNRRAFEQRLRHALANAREQDARHALCYLDLDQFKVVNDTCGHLAGDELLRQLGPVLRRCTRERDTLARLGGDEFAILMEGCPLAQAQQIAERVKSELEDYRFVWEEYSFRVGASIGVVPIHADSPAVDSILGLADNACYIAKEQGRNRVHVYHEDDTEVARRSGEMQWVVRLDSALDAGRFRLARQPIVAVEGGHAGEHFEVLLRMVDERGALVSPGAFLPAAERYGVAPRIDRWVVGHTLERLAADPRALESLYQCSINLSGQSLADASFLDHLEALIRASPVPPGKLCFEITETAAIANMAAAHRFIEALRALGCHFALDDFGSGLSSFAYLKTLPVDLIKIDGMFVKDIAEDPIDLAMVTAISRIGQVMGKRTIAEFVESEAVLERLREIGVDFAQGYHIGRPVPFGEEPPGGAP